MKNKLAVFDIDGTIFRKNLHFVLINELVFMKVFPKKVKNISKELINEEINRIANNYIKYSSWFSEVNAAK